MSNIFTNFITYDLSTVNDGISILKYEPKDYEKLEWTEVGYIVRELRNKNKMNCIFSSDKNIYALNKIENSPENFNDYYHESKNTSLCMDNSEDHETIERLLGSMIVNKLMRDKSTVWKIYESYYRSIYDVSKFGKTYDRNRIELHTGFVFRPRILNEKQIGIFIDCKSKMFFTKTLEDSAMLNMVDTEDDKYLVDYCPVQNCEHKINPFSPCRLSVPTSGKIFVKENEFSTEDTCIKGIDIEEEEEDEDNNPSKTQINLIEYHNMKKICPRMILGDELNKTLHSIKIQIGNSFYDYPPERLRPRVSFDKIPKKDRTALMSSMILSPPERFRKTLDYAELLNRLTFEDDLSFISSNPIYSQKSKRTGKTKFLYRPKLLLNNDYESIAPAFDIYTKKPWDAETRKCNKISLYFLCVGEITNSDLKELKEYPWEEEIQKMLHLDVSIINPDFSNRKLDYNEELNRIDSEKPNCIVLVYGKIKDNENVIKLEENLYSQKIPTQGINIDAFIEKRRINEISYFRNIFLGIYAKSGFIPWILNKRHKKNNFFLGIVIRTSNFSEKKYLSLTKYDNIGRLIKIFYRKWDKDAFNQELHRILDHISSSEKEINLTVLNMGKIQQDEIDTIEKVFRSSNTNEIMYKLFEVHQNSLVRLYEERSNKIKPSKIGMCLLLPLENEAYFVGSKSFSGTSRPTKIKLISSSFRGNEFEDDIQKIFDQTQAYIGYTNFRISLPIPVYAAQQTMNKLIKYGINSYESDKPFFI